jgi:hypothetical protein
MQVHANQLYARELVLGCAHVDLSALRQSQALTQFTCFTSTKVQILTLCAHADLCALRQSQALTQFTYFTSTKVQILTLSPLLRAADGNTSKAGAAPPGGRDAC